MQHKNKISIIMTIKNETKFLINVLEKLMRQEPDQVILVDGNSTDDHIGLYKTMKTKYKHLDFKIVKNDLKPDSLYDSPFGAFIKGLNYADHEFVSLWSVDDDPYGDYIERMKDAINTYDADLFICSADVNRENMRYQRKLYPFDCYVSPECMVKNFRTFSRRINLVGSVIRKSRVIENMQFITKANFDATYFFFIAFQKGFINIGNPLIVYRSYLNSHGQLGKWKDLKYWKQICKKCFKQDWTTYYRAQDAGLWEGSLINFLALRLVPHLPLWIRRKIYDRIYQYDCKEEK